MVAGKGQFTCGAKGCDQKQALESFEVPFAYIETQKQKQALVKASATNHLPTSAFVSRGIAQLSHFITYSLWCMKGRNLKLCMLAETRKLTRPCVQVRLCQEHSMQLNHRKNLQLNDNKAMKKRKSDEPTEWASKYRKEAMKEPSPRRRESSRGGE